MALEQLDCLEVVWTPSADAFANSPLGRMAARHGIRDMGTLQQQTSEDPNWYWGASADDLGIRWFRRYDEVLDLSDGVEFAHFFAGGRLNWADYSIDRWVDQGLGGATAIVWEGDDGERRDLSYLEVKEQIDRAAGALQSLGVKVRDTVGIILPMIPEAAVALLAIAKIGAISVPMFSGYGPVAIRDRVEQSGAEVIITCDMFYRRGKRIALKATVDEALAGLNVRHVVVVERASESISMHGRDHAWNDLAAAAEPVRKAVPDEFGRSLFAALHLWEHGPTEGLYSHSRRAALQGGHRGPTRIWSRSDWDAVVAHRHGMGYGCIRRCGSVRQWRDPCYV